MRIELRDERRQRVGRVRVNAASRPTRVSVEPHGFAGLRPINQPASGPPAPTPEVFLTWDNAVDDAGQLRRCVACGCTDLFTEKAFPQVTGIIVVLAFIGAVIGAFGLATSPPALVAMGVVLVFDVAILVLSKRRLVCYRCRTTYHELPIARYHRGWDRPTADRYPAPSLPPQVSASPARASIALTEANSDRLAAKNGAVDLSANGDAADPARQRSYFA